DHPGEHHRGPEEAGQGDEDEEAHTRSRRRRRTHLRLRRRRHLPTRTTAAPAHDHRREREAMGHDPGLRGAARAGYRTVPIRPRGPHRSEIRAHRREINVTVSLLTCGHAACEVPGLVDYDKPMVRSGPETTRTELLYAAALEIAERGYSGASFSSVAARLGLTKGAFAYHFPTKQALAVALMEEFDETFSNAVAHAREDFPSD